MGGTVRVGVAGLEEVARRAKLAFAGVPQGEHVTFESVEVLWRTLTPRRWAMIGAMAGKGAMSIRAAGRLVGQDIKTAHSDAVALLAAGILVRSGEGIEFPYEAVHVDFTVGGGTAAPAAA